MTKDREVDFDVDIAINVCTQVRLFKNKDWLSSCISTAKIGAIIKIMNTKIRWNISYLLLCKGR